jgi:hypothetical protein
VWFEIFNPYAASEAIPSFASNTFSEAVKLFNKDEGSNAKASKFKVLSPNPIKSPPPLTSILDSNRSRNVSINLMMFKDITHKQIAEAFLELSDSAFTLEQLEQMQRNLPTDPEIRSIKEYSGEPSTLGVPERYFLELSRVPLLTERIKIMIFRKEFDSEAHTALGKMKAISHACTLLKSSQNIKILLKNVLLLGNFMNFSTFRGNATGFRLETLEKLRLVKSSSHPNMTLLDYICGVSLSELRGTELKREISALERIQQISDSELKSGISSLLIEFEQMLKLGNHKACDKLLSQKIVDLEGNIAPLAKRLRSTLEECVNLIADTCKYFCEDEIAGIINGFVPFLRAVEVFVTEKRIEKLTVLMNKKV